MKRVIALIVVGASVQACMAMDGEHERLQKKPAGDRTSSSTQDRAHDGTQIATPDSDVQILQSGDASVPPVSTSSTECVNKTCAGATPFCCATFDQGTCVDAKTTSCTQDRFLMRCDDPTDCAAGEVCCGWWDETKPTKVWESACTAASACKPGESADFSIGVGIMCMSDQECPAGSTCTFGMNDWEGKRLGIKAGICSF